MDFTKESFQVENQKAFTFMLHYDWENGIIWLSKQTSKSNKIRITSKDVPISTSEKDIFYKSRTAWGTIPNAGITKECSYVSSIKNPQIFEHWKKFMYDRYMNLKRREINLNKN